MPNQKHTSYCPTAEWLFSFICSTPYYLLLQDTIHFCPTPSDPSTSQTLTQTPHPRTFLSPSCPQVHLLHPSSIGTLRAPGFLITLQTGSSTTHLPSPPCPQLLIHFSFSSCGGKPGDVDSWQDTCLSWARFGPQGDTWRALRDSLMSFLWSSFQNWITPIFNNFLWVRFGQASKHTHQPSLSPALHAVFPMKLQCLLI